MPKLVLFRGQPGVGKTTLAKCLHEHTGWDYIARDDLKVELLKNGCPEGESGWKSYELLWERLAGQLVADKTVIADTNLNQPIASQALETLVAKTGASVMVLACYCDKKDHKAHIESRRTQDLPGFFIDSWEKYQTYERSASNQPDFTIPHPTIDVDTGTAVDVAALAKKIQTT